MDAQARLSRRHAEGLERIAARRVLVTNLVLSALISASGQLALLRSAWQAGRFNPLASRATASELMRVLGYPKFKLSPAICW